MKVLYFYEIIVKRNGGYFFNAFTWKKKLQPALFWVILLECKIFKRGNTDMNTIEYCMIFAALFWYSLANSRNSSYSKGPSPYPPGISTPGNKPLGNELIIETLTLSVRGCGGFCPVVSLVAGK